MTYLLDTHVAIWWVTQDRKLDRDHARILERADRAGEPVAISAISLWEIAKLVQGQRLALAGTVEALLADFESHMTLLPLTAEIAIESTRLGARMHADPADQLIVATARCHALTLLTSDRMLIESGLVAVA